MKKICVIVIMALLGCGCVTKQSKVDLPPQHKSPTETATEESQVSIDSTRFLCDSVFTGDDVDVHTKPLIMKAPKYSKKAKEKHIEGKVICEFIIDTTGHVVSGSVEIISAEPEGIFEETVIEGVLQWTFSPAVRDGRKVCVKWKQPIEFKVK